MNNPVNGMTNLDPLKLEHQLCFRLYSASRKMTRIYQPILDKHGLTYPQYILLMIMWEHESMDFKELSKCIDLKTATLTPIVQKLVSLGYATKEKNPEDGRRINVGLTGAGKKLKEEMKHVPMDLANGVGLEHERYLALITELDYLMDKFSKNE